MNIDGDLLECCTLLHFGCVPTFQRIIMLLSLALKIKAFCSFLTWHAIKMLHGAITQKTIFLFLFFLGGISVLQNEALFHYFCN